MIRLFRHDGLELMLNVDMIKNIQAGTATVITLVSGEEIKVKNTLTDVLTKIRAWRQGMEDENSDFAPNARLKERSRKAPAASRDVPDPGSSFTPREPS